MKSVVFSFVAGAAVAIAPSVAEARGCSEVSNIVGYHRCTRFGNGWSTESAFPMEVELGIGYLTLDTTGRTIHGSFGKGQVGSYTYPGNVVGHGMSALPLDLRIGGAIFPWLYLGGELEVGAGSDRLPATSTSQYSIAASSHGINAFGVGGGGYLGLRLPLTYFAFRAETLFAARAVGVNQNATSLTTRSTRTGTSEVTTGVVEPRFFADFWIDPHVTMSIYAGFNALKLGDRVGGLMIGFHGKAYDGGFTAW